MKFDTSKYNLEQLRAIDRSVEALMFKQLGDEPFEPTYRADPKQFRKLIRLMVGFKSDLMHYFRKQYDNRYRLIQQGSIRADDSEDDSRYFFPDEWNTYDQDLAKIIDTYTTMAYDLGLISLALALSLKAHNHSVADVQNAITSHAIEVAGDINATTKARAVSQIKASLALEEDRAAFDLRLKKVFENPYRGRFIAQQEALTSYIEGKNGLAVEQGMKYKMWLGSQATDVICGETNGQVVPINGTFKNGFFQPLAHFGCRCDIAYSDSDDPNSFAK